MVMEVYIPQIIGTLGVIIVILVIFVVRLEVRFNRLLRGHKAQTIEESVALLEKDIKALGQFRKDAGVYLENVEKRLGRSIQGIGTVRFNPFRGNGEGGNQSFASSFLNEKGDGVIISSLYSRDHVSVFSKPVKEYKSEYELTQEEKDSMEKAKQSFVK
jgi:hypothetical protein